MTNTSGLKPLGKAILVEPYEPDRKQSVIALPDAVRDRALLMEQRAIIVEVGPAAWMDEPVPRAAVGDKVLVSRMAGYMAIGPADGRNYRLVNERDVFCGITAEGEAANG